MLDRPSEDPIAALNRDHADLSPNAADAYRAAIDALQRPPCRFEDSLAVSCGPALPDWIPEWVEANRTCLEHFLAAAEIPDCWFDMAWSWYGQRLHPICDEHSSRMWALRDVETIARYDARLAADRQDWPRFARNIRAMDALSRHALQGGTFFDATVGFTCQIRIDALVRDALQRRMQEPEDARQLHSLLQFLAEPLPNIAHLWLYEWAMERWSIWRSPRRTLRSWFHNRRREDARISERYTLAHAWVNQPIHEAVAPDNPKRRALLELVDPSNIEIKTTKCTTDTDGNTTMGDITGVDDWTAYARTFVTYVRTAAWRAGLVALLGLFAHRGKHGDWPNSLGELDRPPPPDPFTNQPLIYRRWGDDFVLYATSWNQRDDGCAQPIDNPHEFASGDLVFWPLERNLGFMTVVYDK